MNLYRPIPSLPWMHCDKKSRRYNPMTKNPGSRVQSPGYSNTLTHPLVNYVEQNHLEYLAAVLEK
jgi:hypothetical protein